MKNLKTNLDWALYYQSIGLSIIPTGANKISRIKWEPYQDRIATIEEITTWWKQWPDANPALVTGKISGVVAFDLDVKHGRTSKEFNIPPTACAKSGSGGEHFFFRHPVNDSVKSGSAIDGEGVDSRGDGGYILLPPSVNENGGVYEWIVPLETKDDLAEMPDWLKKLTTDNVKEKKWLNAKDGVSEGSRNDAAASMAGKIISSTAPELLESLGWDQLKGWNNKNAPPLLETELRNVWESIIKYHTDDTSETEENSSQKMDLLELVTKNPKIELFRDNYGNGHAHVVVDSHKEVMICKGTRFRQWLSHTYMEQYGNIADPSTLNTAIHSIESTAIFKGKEYKLHNRVAKIGDTVWLDLADAKNRAVRITPTGWDIVDEPPILFRRHTHQKEQVEPERGGDINKLFDFINVTGADQQLLLLVYLVACFIPDFPHVLLYIHGQQGSSKSTMCKILRRLVDPSRIEVLHMPKDERELKLQLFRHHLIFYDNVDGISDAISAILCIGVTGGSSSERLYFTNGEDFLFDFQLNISLNGINISAVKPDLLERSLLFGLSPVEESKRRDEAEIYKGFEVERPKILGAILDVVVKALAIRPGVELINKPRMADFAMWGIAIAEALGHTRKQFLDVYGAKIREQSEEALAESVVATALIVFMKDKTVWKDTPQVLLNELIFLDFENGDDGQHQKVSAQQLPKVPQVLMRELNTLKPNLLKIGIKIDSDRENGIRIVTISKIDKNTDQTANVDLETTTKDDIDDIIPPPKDEDGIDNPGFIPF